MEEAARDRSSAAAAEEPARRAHPARTGSLHPAAHHGERQPPRPAARSRSRTRPAPVAPRSEPAARPRVRCRTAWPRLGASNAAARSSES
eukprot:4236845-Prymnesium_polylepis.1